jgi:hypothetical protein
MKCSSRHTFTRSGSTCAAKRMRTAPAGLDLGQIRQNSTRRSRCAQAREEVEPNRERANNIAGTLQRAVTNAPCDHVTEKPAVLLAETLTIEQMSRRRSMTSERQVWRFRRSSAQDRLHLDLHDRIERRQQYHRWMQSAVSC